MTAFASSFKIFDLDRHMIEPVEIWREYLPTKYAKLCPEWIELASPPEPFADRLARLGDYAMMAPPKVLAVAGQPIWRGISERCAYEMAQAAQRRGEDLLKAGSGWGHLETMREQGIERALLLPTYASYLVYDEAISAESSCAYAHAYNRWLAAECRADPRRLYGAALLSRHKPESMAVELERLILLGHCAVVLRPNPVRGQTLGHPDLEPFWSACEAGNIPVFLHEGAHARVESAGSERYVSRFGQIVASHAMEAMLGLLSLIEGGVFERHPNLRIAILEAGCGWLPYWMWRMDALWTMHRFELENRVRQRPSDYVRRQVWVAFEPSEPNLSDVIFALTSKRLIFGTDFPHLDHGKRMTQELHDEVGEGASAKDLCWNNAIELLGIERSG